jgi:[acyl-carrier-protein] S-malonyltransferase
MNVKQLKNRVSNAAFAFRGYNVTNLGRSPELLAHAAYGPIVAECLQQASHVCSESTGHKVDLVRRVRQRRETTLKTYADAAALIMAMELAQLRLLKEFFGIEYQSGKLAYGFSLGEITALIASDVIGFEEALRIPLELAADCVKLAADVTLGVLFSRGRELPLHEVRRLCLQINEQGRGVIDVSAYLSPNSLLIMGQGDTLDRFKQRMKDVLPPQVYLRKNSNGWPPLHTPIIWEKFIPNRCSMLMHTVKVASHAPRPPILSLVTGQFSYDEFNVRDLVCRWTDQPQHLWDAICETLSMGIETVIHIGPEPNLIPATFERLAENVKAQTKNNLGMRALSAVVNRPWLKSLLPARTALLRAPLIQHVILEDWLLSQEVK